MLALNLLYFVLSCIVMVFAGTFLIKNLTKIARFLLITEFAAAFIIMAVATSLPELFIGITSALAKNPALSFGNVMGANILNLTLITGIIILVARKIEIKSKKIRRDAFFTSLIILLPIILFLIGNKLSRYDGAILLAVFFMYSYRLIKQRKKFKKKLEDRVKRKEIVLTTFLFILFLFVLFFSAKFVVHYASLLVFDLKLPAIMIGLFLVSFGTTLPELIFGVRAAQLKHADMSLGDQLGTMIANSTLVLGVAALIYPIEVAFAPFMISAIFLFVTGFLFVTFVESGRKLDTREGISLILLYIFFVIIEFYVRGFG